MSTGQQLVEFDITGMTCASCSARIEKKLNKIDGVSASVNLATEKATVSYAGPVTITDLVGTVESAGYGARVIEPDHGHGRGDDRLDHSPVGESSLQRRALVSMVLTVPVVVLAMAHWLHVPGSAWIQLALTTPVVAWAAWPFHRAAAINARHRASTMDTLVSIGVLAAYLWSLSVTVRGEGHLYFETAAVVTTFLLIGRWLEARATDRSREALRTLLDRGAKDAIVLRPNGAGGEAEVRVPVAELRVGDRFVVRPGEQIAADGVVVDGSAAVDTSLLTGEPVPVDVTVGAAVTGATVNRTGRVVIEATAVGTSTRLAAIGRLIERAQTGKAPVQRLADRISAMFVPVVLALALLTFTGWLIATGDTARALEVAIAVLVIACPCALGLATPTALLVGTGRGAQLGILIKGPQVLEQTQAVDTIVLDKTGTVTTGSMSLVDIATAGRLPQDAALKAAAAVEAGSEHPIARAILTEAGERGLTLPAGESFTALTGSGARAEIRGTEVTVGRAELFDAVPEELRSPRADGTTVWVGWDGQARAMLTVSDTLRPTSSAAVTDLREAGLTAYLLTGDNSATAHAVAASVGIDARRVTAEARPEDKVATVTTLQQQGRRVAMVGDGINDAAALAAADLGIAMGSGTDVAADAADIVVLRSDLSAVVDAIALSRVTLRTIKVNLAWAFGYNIAAIPLAMAGLLNPMIAGAAMAASSVLVVTNSLRLRRFGR